MKQSKSQVPQRFVTMKLVGIKRTTVLREMKFFIQEIEEPVDNSGGILREVFMQAMPQHMKHLLIRYDDSMAIKADILMEIYEVHRENLNQLQQLRVEIAPLQSIEDKKCIVLDPRRCLQPCAWSFEKVQGSVTSKRN